MSSQNSRLSSSANSLDCHPGSEIDTWDPTSGVVSGNKSPTIKSEDDVIITDSVNRYICGECSKAFHVLASFRSHFMTMHLPRTVPCRLPQCDKTFHTANGAKKHYEISHQGDYPCLHEGCLFRGKDSRWLALHLQRHPNKEPEPHGNFKCLVPDCMKGFRTMKRLTEHRIDAHSLYEFKCGFRRCRQHFDCMEDREQHFLTRHSGSLDRIEYSCPQPGCSRLFSLVDDLYDHFTEAKHTLFNTWRSQNPFRCAFNFCHSAYPTEDEIKYHHTIVHASRRTHPDIVEPFQNPKQFSLRRISNMSIPGLFDLPSEAQSEEESLVHPFLGEAEDSPETDDLVHPLLSRAEDFSEEDDTRAGENAIEINEDGVVLLSDLDSTLPVQSEVSGSYKMAIGYLLQTPQTHRDIPLQSSDDDYPDSAALDDHEQDSQSDCDTDMDEYSNEVLLERALTGVLCFLNLEHAVTATELIELWSVFVEADQGKMMLKQLNKINTDDTPTAIQRELEKTALVSLITAWINFKLLTDQIPPNLRANQTSAREIAWSVLKHCMILEDMTRRAIPAARAAGISVPDRVHEPTTGYDFSPDEPFPYILEALAERALCRKLHQKWLRLNNIMVLEQIVGYHEALRDIAARVYPGMRGSKLWLEMYGPE